MEERKTFTYDGMNSADFGLYIAGDSVYDAPTRDMDMITIPGRNGQLSIDQGRFDNITVTYPCFIWADTQEEFRTKVRAIRNWLCAKTSYFKLSDEYNPESYRLGIYKSGLEVEPIFYNRAGRFKLSFDCKPQRFLLSGDEPITLGEWGETETYSGSIATFEAESNTGIKSLVANIGYNAEGIADVSITRTGKNLAIIPQELIDADRVSHGITFHATGKSSWKVSGTATADTYNIGRWVGNYHFLPKGTYTVTTSRSGTISGAVSIYGYDRVNTTNRRLVAIARWNTPQTFTFTEDSWYVFYETVTSGSTLNGEIAIQIEQGSTGTAWESSEGEYIAKELGQAVYGGTLDLISGALTSTLNADGTEKTTPEVIQLTGEQVQTLLGVNNIWADAGTVDVEIGENPNILTNPTPYTAQPIFEVEGSGTLTVGNVSMTIANNGTTVIDSEMMEAYEEENGAIVSRNDMVSGEFPTLKEGNNNIGTVGLTSVKVTPKWWEV